METVDTLPMAILSGQYQSPSVYKSPLSDVMSVYNQAQPGRDVAAARQEVADRPVKAWAADREARIAEDLQRARRELADLEEQLRLATMVGSSAATSQDTQVDRTPMPEQAAPSSAQETPDSLVWKSNYKQGI
jgi:hypothetical protein